MLDHLYKLLVDGTDPSFVLDILNHSSFDEIVEIDLNKNTCKNIYHVEGKYFVPLLVASFTELFSYCADNMIHPNDRSIFYGLMNPKTIAERLNESNPQGYLYSQFRYKLQNGSYRLVEQCVVGGEGFGFKDGIIRFYVFDIQNQKNVELGIWGKDINNSEKRDHKTTLYDDRAFFVKAQQLIDSLENIDEWRLISMDIEHFRLFNEWYGHEAGEMLLSKIGVKLAEEEKESGGVAGYVGQDDFCILTKANEQDVIDLYDEICHIIESSGSLFGFFPVFGICRILTRSITELFDMASVANLAAKDVKNRHICYYSSKMREQTENEYRILNKFKSAIDNHEITFYLQPQCRTSTKKIVGAEALARWIEKDGTMIMPGTFIPVLEKYGFVAELDCYIWEDVCRWLRKRLDEGSAIVPISINVSRIDLYSIDVAEYLKQLVDKYKVSPDLVKIEITESAYADDTLSVEKTINKLHELGFMVLMDDFGSGYSSLNSLSSIKVDVVKLDAKFLGFNDKDNTKALHILESIINMNKTIGIPMIVEGVEHKKHVDFLEGMGCRYVQGFYFYRPMNIASFERIISNKESIDERGFLFQTNQQFQIREFLDQNIYSDSMLNNIIGATAIYLWNDKTNDVDIIRFNQQFYQSVDAIDFSQRLESIQNYMPKADVPLLMNTLQEALNDKLNGASAVLRFYKSTGTLMSFFVRFYHIGSGENGHRFFGAAQDVSELVKLQHQMDLFSDVSLESIIFLARRNDKLVFNVAVHGLKQKLKLEKQELQDLLNSGVFVEKYAPDLKELLEKLKRHEVGKTSFIYQSKRDGTHEEYLVDINRVYDETSDAEYVIALRVFDAK